MSRTTRSTPTPSLPAAIRETTVQEQTDLGKTENDQQQEPKPEGEGSVRALGRFAGFGGMVWPRPDTDLEWMLRYGTPTRADLLFAASVAGAYAALVCAPATKRARVVRQLRAAMLTERAPVPAVDQRAERAPSRSTPDDALAPPAVSPEAAPPRATTPPDEYERLRRQKDEIIERQERSLVDASAKIAFWKRHACSAPSLESGALLDELIVAEREAWEIEGYAGFDIAKFERRDQCRAELDRHISTLERDAARMRAELEAVADVWLWVEREGASLMPVLGRGGEVVGWSCGHVRIRDRIICPTPYEAVKACRAALVPSGEPTTTTTGATP